MRKGIDYEGKRISVFQQFVTIIAGAAFAFVLGAAATAPHFEVNYGALPDSQLHVIVPPVYSSKNEGSKQYGLGDIELGVKLPAGRDIRGPNNLTTYIAYQWTFGPKEKKEKFKSIDRTY